MKKNFKSVIEILDYYRDEEQCIKLLEQQRWGGKVCCPHCGSDKKPYVIEGGKRYKCSDNKCYKKFSVLVGTVCENSKIPLRIWFAAIYLITAHKKGISSHQLGRDLGVTQRTAWFLLHRIREMLKENEPELLSNIVEVDETFVGGKHSNRHAKKKEEIKQAGFKDKTMVVGLLERGGKVRTQIVKDLTSESLVPVVYNNVKEGSIMFSDEQVSYNPISKDYFHEKVKHSKGEYVRGIVHSNGIENYWSLLKRGIIGIYHQVSKKHLDRYCTEFNYRFNTRALTDTQRFHIVLKQTEGRLKYDDLIKE